MPTIINTETGEISSVNIYPQWADGVWNAGDLRFTDPDQNVYKAGPPSLGPIHFKLLFQIAELVQIDSLTVTDPVVKTFMGIVDDPRTDTVDLSLKSVQDGIAYVLGKIYLSDSVKLNGRLAEILTGTLK